MAQNEINADSTALQGVGLIVPPRDVRAVLEKTAAHVARRPALEARVKENFANDPKFSFFYPTDPYHAYYLKKIADAKSALENDVTSPKPTVNGTAPQEPQEIKKPDATKAPEQVTVVGVVTKAAEPSVSKLKAARVKAEASRREPREPPPDDLFTIPAANPTPTAFVMDVMKLTAQFVAKNGNDFQIALFNKEMRNSLFDFLKPMHPFFIIFQRLVDAYKAILDPPGGKDVVIANLKREAATRQCLMDKVWYLHDWERQKNEREHEAAQSASERLKAAQIDWQDFVVLETIDLDDDEEALPAPIANTKQLPRILAAAEQTRREMEKNRSGVDMDVDMEIEEEQEPVANVVVANVDSDIPQDRIRKGADALAATSAVTDESDVKVGQEATVQLPSGQTVPMSQAEASMRAELLDPSYKDERARALEKNRLQNLASNEEMARSLARLSKSRTEGEVYNRADLQKALSVKPKPSPSEADATLKKAVPSGPQLPAARRSSPNAAELPPPEKRARVEAAVDALVSKSGSNADGDRPHANGTEEELLLHPAENVENTPAGLVPAEEWLKRVGDSVPVRIKVPKHPNTDWRLQGQEIEMSAPLRSTVGKLKTVLTKYTKLPVNKQKLQCDHVGFLKDKMTLAFYNIGKGSTISLELKERGGRKKNN